MKRKGFTLIELLAVIVILAIIALIAIPVITNVIEKAKKGAAESSAIGYINAVENQVAINAVDTSKEDIIDGNYEVLELSTKGVSVKGNGPKSGNVTITKGQVTACSLVIDKYTITCLENGKVQVSGELKGEKLEGTKISVVAKNLLDNNTTYGNYTYMNGTYLKGAQENNYVWYNGFLWRIMGINENGTVRLITEENVTALPNGLEGEEIWYTENEGYINDWLNKYFLNNLDSGKANIITQNEWCMNVAEGFYNEKIMRQTCDGGELFSAKVGLISMDEYNLSVDSSSTLSYLVNSQLFWTLTPYNFSHYWRVDFSGNITYNVIGSVFGVRPVINVSADAIVTDGNGSLSNAYVLNQSKIEKNGKLNENATSGEYVSLDEKIYRVVSKTDDGIKLIYDGYYVKSDGTLYKGAYGADNNTFTLSSGIGQLLNNDILTWLGNSDKIVETNWYQTNGVGILKYETILNDKTNPIMAKVGLINIGEILSVQSASILTKNYTEGSNYLNASDYWTLTKNDSSFMIWYVYNNGFGSSIGAIAQFYVRPAIVVSNDTMITSGNGTLQSPYVID